MGGETITTFLLVLAKTERCLGYSSWWLFSSKESSLSLSSDRLLAVDKKDYFIWFLGGRALASTFSILISESEEGYFEAKAKRLFVELAFSFFLCIVRIVLAEE